MSEYRDDFREVQREAYWSLPRLALMVLVVMLVMYGVGFLATGGDLAIYKFWAPKRANAERQVFENTQSYVQGKVAYLSEMRMEYESAKPDSDQRSALRRMILTESAQIDRDHLPADLNAFVESLRGAQ